jgi:hypothetical protein
VNYHTCHATPMPFPYCAMLYVNYHTCHAALLPFSDSAVSFVKVCVVAGNILTASPTVQWIDMLLITTFMERRTVAGRSPARAGRPHEKLLSEQHGHGTAGEWHGMCELALKVHYLYL